jgi:hypothetical protein
VAAKNVAAKALVLAVCLRPTSFAARNSDCRRTNICVGKIFGYLVASRNLGGAGQRFQLKAFILRLADFAMQTPIGNFSQRLSACAFTSDRLLNDRGGRMFCCIYRCRKDPPSSLT